MKPDRWPYWILLCLAALFVLAAAAHAAEVPDVRLSRIDIRIAGSHGDADKWAAMARDLILLRVGDRLLPEHLDRARSALESSGFFQQVDIRSVTDDEGATVLACQLVPFPLIEDIRISGAFPVFEREILNAMTLYPGKPFDQSALPRQETAITDLLQRNGYIKPLVRAAADEQTDGRVVIRVDIEKDAFYSVRQFVITGNQSFSSARLKIRTDTWLSSLLPGAMSRFIEKKVAGDVDNLVAFYRKNGYADVAITPDIRKNDRTGDVDIDMRIQEGPVYDITFHGNDEFWDCTLKDDLEPLQKGNRSNLGLRRSVRRIRERYQKAGYAECRVTADPVPETSEDPATRPVRIVIEEGPRSLVRQVRVEGHKRLAEESIRDQILTQPPGLFSDGEFSDQRLANDLQAISALYLNQGYMSVRIDRSVDWQPDPEQQVKWADILLSIDEGPRTIITSIEFTGLDALTREEALQSITLDPGGPFREHALKNDGDRLAAAVSEKGYPHVVVNAAAQIIPDQISPDRTGAAVTFSVNQGQRVRMGRIHSVGHFRTRASVIADEVEMETGAPFSLVNMLESQRNIQNIRAFETARVNPVGLKEKTDRVHLLVDVEEKKPYAVEVGLGYDTSRHFYANTRLEDKNLLGLNKQAHLGLEVSEIGQKGEAGLIEPRFLGTRIVSNITLFGENREEFNQDFGTRTIGGTLGFSRKLPLDLTAGLSFSLERKEQFLRGNEVIAPGEEEAYDPRAILVTSPSMTYDAVDSFIRPRRGVFSMVRADISRGLENSLDDFVKYRGEIKLYYTLFKRLTLAFRGRAGYIQPFDSASTIPEDQLFYLAGLSDVRGYDQNSLRMDAEGNALGGRTSYTGTLEARFDTGFKIEITPFFDTGSIRDTLIDEGSDDFRSSVGIGLRYLIPYLPIGVQYGHKLDRKKDIEDAGMFYVTVGYIF